MRRLLHWTTVFGGAAVLLLLAGRLQPLAAQGDERESPEVQALVIRGVHAVDKNELQKSIATQASHCKSILFKISLLCRTKSRLFFQKNYLDRTEFKRDVLRIKVFYWKRGWRDVEVDTSVVEHGDDARVSISIHEKLPTKVSSIGVAPCGEAGVRVRTSDSTTDVIRRCHVVLEPKEIGRTMVLHAGQPFNLLALDSSLTLMRDKLWNKGYADAVVVVDSGFPQVDTARKTAAVRVTYASNWLTKVGDIHVTGNEKVSERTVRRSLAFKTGDIFRQRDVLESQRTLYESNLFRSAHIVVPPQGDSVKTLEITLREAPLRESRTSAGFNTVEFLQAEERFTWYNFQGGGRRLDLRATVGNILAPQLNGIFPFQDVTPSRLSGSEESRFQLPTWRASADFTQPWLGSVRTSAGLGIFAHRSSTPGVFIDRSYGASASITRQLGYKAPLSLTYRYELTEVDAGDVYFCVNFGVCETRTIGVLQGRHALAPLSLSYFTDRSNNLFNPTGGYIFRADAEHSSATTLSDFRYNRLFGEAIRYFGVGRKMALATRLRAGFVRTLGANAGSDEEVLHPRKRFYAGGASSVRGYGENQLGPRVLTVDPKVLLDSSSTHAPCTEASIRDGSCDPNGLPDDQFQPRPTGGSSLLEGNVELRFPLWQALGGAVFLDGAFVGEGPLRTVTNGTGALTPGFGFRYLSPAGAIRVDLGFRPKVTEKLSVITEVTDPDGTRRIVQLTQRNDYDPTSGGGFLSQITNRLTLHLSIGQAF